MRNWTFIALLLLILGSGVGVMVGEMDEAVGLESVMEVWSDVMRDVDQFGLQLTRVSAEEEMRLGRELTRSLEIDETDDQWAGYIQCVGDSLTPYVHRPEIKYEFHVISYEMPNAFAWPGGQVFVTTGLLDELETEAELAAILGHEMSHVDARHCIELFQYEMAISELGIGRIAGDVEFLHRIVTVGYSKYQELEADLQGLRIAIQAGYDPQAAMDVMNRVLSRFDPWQVGPAEQPVNEVLQAVGEALRDYSRTHPYTADRVQRMHELIGRYQDKLADEPLYHGRENYQQRRAKSELFLESEVAVCAAQS